MNSCPPGPPDMPRCPDCGVLQHTPECPRGRRIREFWRKVEARAQGIAAANLKAMERVFELSPEFEDVRVNMAAWWKIHGALGNVSAPLPFSAADEITPTGDRDGQ